VCVFADSNLLLRLEGKLRKHMLDEFLFLFFRKAILQFSGFVSLVLIGWSSSFLLESRSLSVFINALVKMDIIIRILIKRWVHVIVISNLNAHRALC
jgi:hypothetical protein